MISYNNMHRWYLFLFYLILSYLIVTELWVQWGWEKRWGEQLCCCRNHKTSRRQQESNNLICISWFFYWSACNKEIVTLQFEKNDNNSDFFFPPEIVDAVFNPHGLFALCFESWISSELLDIFVSCRIPQQSCRTLKEVEKQLRLGVRELSKSDRCGPTVDIFKDSSFCIWVDFLKLIPFTLAAGAVITVF